MYSRVVLNRRPLHLITQSQNNRPVERGTSRAAARRDLLLPACGFARSTRMAAAKKVLVPVGNGSEELEAVAVIDILVRGGAAVTVASVESTLQVTCSRGVKLVADKSIKDCTHDEYDLIVLPGGMPGAEHLRDSHDLTELLRKQKKSDKLYAAICASPAVVFQTHGLLEGVHNMTAHPGFSPKLPSQTAADQRVVVDGKCVTSRGPGTAIEFSLKLVELLFGREKADSIAKAMVVQGY